jgi:hypothetical protein
MGTHICGIVYINSPYRDIAYLYSMKVIEFLTKYKECLSLSGIEKELVITTGTLKKVLSGSLSLSYKNEVKVADWFNLGTPSSDKKPVRVSKSTDNGYIPMKGSWRQVYGSIYTDGVKNYVTKVIGSDRCYKP